MFRRPGRSSYVFENPRGDELGLLTGILVAAYTPAQATTIIDYRLDQLFTDA